ncbi:MAG: NAD(P)-binding protein [Gemmatimonadales bacterium]
MTPSDRDLGMGRAITRRDFLNGVAVGVSGAMALPWLSSCAAPPPASAGYPPALTGLRGSYPGTFEPFHAVRDGIFWQGAAEPRSTGEEYDLVIVGGGISGLSAAHYYREARPDARILVLDNHDDFGGHAKRNEFTHEGRTILGYGGVQSIDSPAPYSAVAHGLLDTLGIDVGRWSSVVDWEVYRSRGLEDGFFFDAETFGVDRLVKGSVDEYDQAFIDAAPVRAIGSSATSDASIPRFDPLRGQSEAAKRLRLATTSVRRLPHDDVEARSGRALPVFQTLPHDLFGVGIDAMPAQDGFGLGFPGFQGMGLDPNAKGPGQSRDSTPADGPAGEEFYFHFPDGNASIARLLVRRLLPDAVPGTTADDVVTSRVDYDRLDRASTRVRIRLSSVVVKVRHLDRGGPGERVEVTYVKDGKLVSVTGRQAVLACWHSTIPYMCDELDQTQRDALRYAVKVPLVYTTVLIRNWNAFAKLGIQHVTTPGLWHTSLGLDFPVSLGGYQCARTPEDPVVVHLSKAACYPGVPVRDQHRLGRAQLLDTSYETIERSIRAQFGRVLGEGGFDPAADILAITVNRWSHGYAYQYNSLFDRFWLEGTETPCEVARRPFGRIAIANADSGAYAYTDGAIDHAHRAVRELLALG